MLQQKFVNDDKLQKAQLPTLVSSKSQNSQSLQSLTSLPFNEKQSSKISQGVKENTEVKTQQKEDEKDEIKESYYPADNQPSLKKRNSQFYIHQMKKVGPITPSSQTSKSYQEFGNYFSNANNTNDNNNNQKLDIKSINQFEQSIPEIGVNKRQIKNLASQLISPLKMMTPNRYSLSSKMDSSLTEFLDFNSQLQKNKDKRSSLSNQSVSDTLRTLKPETLNIDKHRFIINDFVVMGKDLFAIGTNNGYVQIWKYKEFKFQCTFQIQAHYSAVRVSSTNVSGVIFSYGMNQKGSNSVKIWNNDTESTLTEIIEIIELHSPKSQINHILSLAEVFKGTHNNIIFATYGTDDINQIKIWDFSFDNRNFHNASKNQIKQKQIINTDNTELLQIKQDFDKNIFIGCSKKSVIFWKYTYNKDDNKLDIQKLQSYTFKINLEENQIVDIEMGQNNVYVSTKNGEIVLLELNGVFIKSLQFFSKYLKQIQREDIFDLSLKKVLYYTVPEKIVILCQKVDSQNIIPYLFDKVESNHEILSTLKIQLPLNQVITISNTQFITLEKNELKYNYL